MKLSQALLALLSTGFGVAQIIDLPPCSLQCFLKAMSHDGCSSLTDFACHCKQPILITEVTPCVEQACNAKDQSSVSSAVVAECSSAGAPISIPPVTSTSSTQNNPAMTSQVTAPPSGSVQPSGPVVTLPTETAVTSYSTPLSSPTFLPPSGSQTGPLNATASSPPFVGGAETFHTWNKYAGAAAAIAVCYLL
ncbi:hypothetical protein BJX70DRAFT_396231 [Aspergillus crustosus]